MWSESVSLFNPYEALTKSRDINRRLRRNVRKPFTGDQREVKRFVWYPMKIKGKTYWLKRIVIKQSYDTRHSGWCNDWVVY